MLKSMLASLVRRDSAPRFLNVGGGSKEVPVPAHYTGWEHLLLDVNPGGGADIVLDARRLEELPAAQFDAVYCAHNLEHYYAHEVPLVLAGFAHVLRPGGFVELRVPDIEAVMRDALRRGLDLEDALYASPAGPITVHDVLYGFGAEIARGNAYYAHRTGFSDRSLRRVLAHCGYQGIFALPPAGGFELRVAAFRGAPGAAQRALLKL
jgi:SAM-dependent methyltransferase